MHMSSHHRRTIQPTIIAVPFFAAVAFFASTGVVALQAEMLVWDFTIDEQSIRNGPETDGSTNSPGSGSGTVRIDLATNMVSLDLSWSGLIGDLTKLHIHGPATEAQSNPQHLIEIFGPPDLPAELIATSGTWTDTFELQTLIQTGFDPIEPATVIATMRQGQAYLNVHSTVFGTGEIRGNLGLPLSVPEPDPTDSIGLAFLGAGALIVIRRRRCCRW